MMEFNPDGSLKLPINLQKRKEEDVNKLKTRCCIKIRREIVSFKPPKKCVLHITLSDAFPDNRFVYTLYSYFNQKASVPNTLKKIDDKTFEIEIGTDFRRCSDCNSLIGRYREFLFGNIIEEKGGCGYETKNTFYVDD